VIVLGVDPGTAVTGYGVVSGDAFGSLALIECGVVRTDARQPLALRLRDIHDEISSLIARHHPHAIAVESAFYARNVHTTLVLGHARGVILLAAAQHDVPIAEYPPATIKKCIVGTGAATKEQVQFMVARLLHLRSAPHPSDAADGTAAALAHIVGGRVPRLAEIR